ncbi:MAG TPA: histidine kinase [Lachnospiraceae bacterium]|nr:histidine kinase [Lachnospiraceae bacterium]
MPEQLRENYFLAVRMGLLLILEVYIVLAQYVLVGASAKVLLLLALFIGAMAVKELTGKYVKWILLGIAVVLWAVMIVMFGRNFILLGILLCYEVFSYIKPNMIWYLTPLVMAFIPSEINTYVQIMVTLFLAMIYIQHDFVVESYKKQTKEDTIQEQYLKRNMYEKENEMQEEIKRGLLVAENQHLEERAKLSQTLHDKLGHNINGSVYQLEAIKVLMDKEPETSKRMIQAVIDQLRKGMDEIRAILRKERPPKYKFAISQLEKLCEECRQKGVEAQLVTEGDLSMVPEAYFEIMLDNAYEAVSNSMKYAKCTKINIKVHVMNQLVRCSIADNGTGCGEVVDGMGISGMRKRMRDINGIIDFETETGFVINMLLPL